MSTDSENTTELLPEWQQAMKHLEDHALTVTTTYGKAQWLPAMRSMAGELGLDRDVRDKELLTFLAAANPASEPIQPGSVIDESLLKAPGSLWGKLLVHGGINLLVSAPKVGKTALVMHFAGCVLRGETKCLGIPIENPFDHLIIVGPDMHVDQWMTLLQREGLAEGPKLSDKVTLWHSGTQISLSEQGIEKIKGECQRHSNSLLLIDTLASSIASLNLDENRSEIAVPLMALRVACASAGFSITTVVNHHASKQGYGSSGTSASRGSSALPGACDSTISLNYFRTGIDGVERTDRRLVLSSEGRTGCQTVMAEMYDAVDGLKWMSHGDASNHRAAEALWVAQDGLSNRQEEAYDLACNFHDQDRLLDAGELGQHLNVSRQKALRCLKALERKGLVAGVKDPGGGRNAPIRYRAVTEKDFSTPSTPETLPAHHACAGEGSSLPHVGQVVDVNWSGRKNAWSFARANIVEVFPGEGPEGIAVKVARLFPKTKAEEMPELLHWPDRVRASQPIAVGTVVEKLVNGEWKSGYVIADGTNPDDLKVSPLGNPMTTYSNLRWELDVREATGSPFADAPTQASDPNELPW